MKTKLLIAILLLGYKMSFAQTAPSYLPKNGLVGWWPFNGNANDESGNNNHGIVTGATLTTDRNGKANSAYSFDGINDYILTYYNEKFSLKQLSISYWIQNEQNKGGCIISKTNIENATGEQFIAGIDKINGKLNFQIKRNSNCKPGSGWQRIYSDNINLSTKNWSNIISIFDGQILKIYKNGILIDSLITIKGDIDFCLGGTLNFGRFWKMQNEFYQGIIDDISIYNRALSQQEIKQIYEGCPKEIASSNSFNSAIYTNSPILYLTAQPAGGKFSGEAISANQFLPTKAKLGKNIVKYNFTNSKGCADSTLFSTIVSDTIGNTCSTYDTLKIKVKLTTGIKTGQFTNMNVYPNPTSDLLIIETDDINGLKGYTYKIVDLQGKEIYKSLISSAKTEIALKSIGAKGIYILHIIDEVGQSIENKKIILE